MIGFEPWEEFPFNQGMLCPKGVKRYLQGTHPDRLLDPLMRTPEGFRNATWDEALDFTARRLREFRRSTAAMPWRSTAALRSPPRRPT